MVVAGREHWTAMITAPTLLARRAIRLIQSPIQPGTPKSGCLMAMVPSLETIIHIWAADNIPPDTLTNDGIETETPATVLYGWNLDFDAQKLKNILANTPPIAITIGKLSRFECPEYDVIKFEVESPALVKLNRDLARVFRYDITPSEHKFNPHVTAAYVTKGSNKDLTAPAIEGYKAVVGQLIYSLPERKGRIVFDLGKPIETTQSSLAARALNLIRAANQSGDANKMVAEQHAAARNTAQERYRRAVAEFIAHAKAEAMTRDKNKREKLKALFLLLMLDAGEDAYAAIYPKLAQLSGLGADRQAPPIKAEPQEFAAGRAQYLGNFAETVMDKMDAAVQQGAHDAAEPREIRRELDKRAEDLRQGAGETVAETEAQSCYGHAQIRILKRAGFKTALWDQIDRPTKRETHAINMEMGPQPLGTLYPNGQRFPGDETAGPGECINCLCVLVGVEKDKP